MSPCFIWYNLAATSSKAMSIQNVWVTKPLWHPSLIYGPVYSGYHLNWKSNFGMGVWCWIGILVSLCWLTDIRRCWCVLMITCRWIPVQMFFSGVWVENTHTHPSTPYTHPPTHTYSTHEDVTRTLHAFVQPNPSHYFNTNFNHNMLNANHKLNHNLPFMPCL